MLILRRGLVLGLLALTAYGQNTTTNDGSSTTTPISTTTAISSSSSTTTTSTIPSSTTSSVSSFTTSLPSSTTTTSSPPTTSSRTSSLGSSSTIRTTSSIISSSTTTRQTTTSLSTSSLTPTSNPTQTSPKATTSTSLSQSRTSQSTTTSTYLYTSVSSSVSLKQSSIETSTVIPFTSSDGATGYRTVSTVIVTETPVATYLATGTFTGSSSATNVPGLLNGNGSGSSGGLSSGAKAGIGAGVGGGVLVAAIFGAWYGMRRRRRGPRIDDTDRYTPSVGNSMIGFGGGGKSFVGFATSEVTSQREAEADPLARYAMPGSDRPTQAPTSVSSGGLPRRPTVGTSASGGYHSRFNELSETQEQAQYAQPGHRSTSSQGSDDQFYSRPLHQRTGSLENRLAMPGAAANEEMDGRNFTRTGSQTLRTQLTKQHPLQQGRIDPSQNF